ncbi:hypothetical protein N9O79_02520 [Luminiphilus sp.]|nr:hypothetical protein [Luminiphilus sp.]
MKRGRSISGGLPFLILTLFFGVGLLVIYKLNPDFAFRDFFGSSEQSVAVKPAVEVERLSPTQLRKELRAYAIRVNRLTPYRLNLMLSLERVHLDDKATAIAFDYEISVAYEDMQFDSGVVGKALMNRYCNDDEFAFMSANNVQVTFRYMKVGRVVHTEVIDRCRLP